MEEYCKIELTQGKAAIVDAADFKWLSQWRWHAVNFHGKWYAQRSLPWAMHVKNRSILMHRLILNAPKTIKVDHRNNDGLDNRRSNIRLATDQQNNYNVGLRKDNRSGYKGVSLVHGKWQASIKINRKVIYLGWFANKMDAARKYNDAARLYHGEFVKLNIV